MKQVQKWLKLLDFFPSNLRKGLLGILGMQSIWVTFSEDPIIPIGVKLIVIYLNSQEILIRGATHLLKEIISSKQRGMIKTCLKLVLLQFFH